MRTAKATVTKGKWEYQIDANRKSALVKRKGAHWTVTQAVQAGKLSMLPSPLVNYRRQVGEHVTVEAEKNFWTGAAVLSATAKAGGHRATLTAKRLARGAKQGKVCLSAKGEVSLPGWGSKAGATLCSNSGVTLRAENTSVDGLTVRLSKSVLGRGGPATVAADYVLPWAADAGDRSARATLCGSVGLGASGVSSPSLTVKLALA